MSDKTFLQQAAFRFCSSKGANEVAAENLALAWISEHPTDENEPATEKWMRELLGEDNCGRLYQGMQWIPEIRNEVNGMGQWVMLPIGSTKGDVRAVVRGLKIKTTEVTVSQPTTDQANVSR